MGNVTVLVGLVTVFVIAGWAGSRWLLARCVMRHEGLRRLEACRRSSRLLRHHRWRAALIVWTAGVVLLGGAEVMRRLDERDIAMAIISVVAVAALGLAGIVTRLGTERCYRRVTPRPKMRSGAGGGSATTIRHPAASRVHRHEA